MQLLTYNEMLEYISDTFDSLIAPRRINRSNSNILYLVFKAISKGYEVIASLCNVVQNKFNPAFCSEEDLVSVGEMVGTEMMKGSASGLHIIAVNKIETPVLLLKGFYTYKVDEDLSFTFEVLDNMIIQGEASETFFAFSNKIGKYPMTEVQDIKITGRASEDEESTPLEITTDLLFSCEDNEALLGTEDETIVEYRQRILTNTTRQDSISEIRTAIKNKPYVFDAQVYFNNITDTVTIDGIDIPPYFMAIFYGGAPRNEIADVVASKSIFPTVETDDSIKVHFLNPIFADSDGYAVNLIPFKTKEFSCNVKYSYNATFVNWSQVQALIKSKLLTLFRGHKHIDYVTEASIFDAIKDMNIENVDILNVDLKIDGSDVDYVEIPISRIPYLVDVNFEKVAK